MTGRLTAFMGGVTMGSRGHPGKVRAVFPLAASLVIGVVSATFLCGCGGDEAAASPRFDGKDVEAWTDELGSEDETLRRRAIEQLGAGGSAAAAVLRKIIVIGSGDTRDTLRWLRAGEMAESALARIGAPAVPAIVDALGDDNSWARIHAAGAVSRMHPAPVEAVERLARNLSHEDSTVRTVSARALGEIGTAAAPAAPALVTTLRDEDRHAREAAATALGGIGAPAADVAHDALVEAFADGVEDVRAAAVQALAKVGPRSSALSALLELLGSDDLASMYVPDTIGAMGAEAAPAVPRLIAALGHKDWDRRSSTAVVLGKLGPRAAAAADSLLGLLDDRIMMVREAAAEALGLIGAAREDVRKRLRVLAAEDEEKRVRTAAKDALERLGD